mmetsp:Transcript_7056/g.43363  ORF Transcript_7056/g.43363 Transcript_7056/m.43363 type:complete len:204 (-) Transcript_7056:27-638(-)
MLLHASFRLRNTSRRTKRCDCLARIAPCTCFHLALLQDWFRDKVSCFGAGIPRFRRMRSTCMGFRPRFIRQLFVSVLQRSILSTFHACGDVGTVLPSGQLLGRRVADAPERGRLHRLRHQRTSSQQLGVPSPCFSCDSHGVRVRTTTSKLRQASTTPSNPILDDWKQRMCGKTSPRGGNSSWKHAMGSKAEALHARRKQQEGM